MKNRKVRLSLLVVVLALTAQLSLISPSTLAQNANSSTMSEGMMQSDRSGRSSRWCNRRCTMSYRRCLRSGGNARACRMRYRVCLRRCSR
jgi:hypothetical protein